MFLCNSQFLRIKNSTSTLRCIKSLSKPGKNKMHLIGKCDNEHMNSFLVLRGARKVGIQLIQAVMVPPICLAIYITRNDTNKATSAFDRKNALVLSRAIGTLSEWNKVIQVTKAIEHTKTTDNSETFVNSNLMTPHQTVLAELAPGAQVPCVHNQPEACEH